jgi:hypothetical protein
MTGTQLDASKAVRRRIDAERLELEDERAERPYGEMPQPPPLQTTPDVSTEAKIGWEPAAVERHGWSTRREQRQRPRPRR